ncbi:MAG: methyltransferase domain-containing protein [Salaquimonas sp.]
MVETPTFRDRLANDIRFLKGWVKQPKSTGSITPTSKQAADLMVSLIPGNGTLPVLELGPGTGPITKAILQAGILPEEIVSIEFNKEFCDHLKKTYPDVNFIQGDAFDLKESLNEFEGQRFRAILSGLPLLNFPASRREKYVEDALGWLSPGAPLIQLCYGPRPPVKSKPGVFSVTPSKWILSNVPPARFWVYTADQ